MLHIIFVILKVVGIMIGLLFGFLLCTMLALLLVPVRYRVGAVKKGEKQQLNIGLSWMLRMVSVAVSGGQKEETVVLIRLFGVRLPLGGGKKPKKDRYRYKKKSGQERSTPREHRQKNPDAGSSSTHENSRLPDYGGRDMTALEQFEDMGNRPPDGYKNDEKSESPAPPGERNTDRTENTQARSRTPSWIHRCSAFVRGIPDRITSLKKKIKALWKKLLSLRKKPEQIKRALVTLYEKPSAFLRMIEEYEIKELSGSLLGEALYLLEHYKPRRIRGYLRFGTGNPALTGMLTGLVYMLLPARADQFDVMPDFYETVFETEAIFTGYIRSVHLGRTALHVFRDKKVRRIFRRLTQR